jgi:Na+/citrate or Na+/malate symporter
MEQMTQLSVIAMVIDLLFGITIGIVLSASWASLCEDHCHSLLGGGAGRRSVPYAHRGRLA